MNCHNCGFYCYEDEFICPNCQSIFNVKLPKDKYEKSLIIHQNISEFEKTKRALTIIKSKKFLFIAVLFLQIAWDLWLSTFTVYRFPVRTNYVIARYSIVFALALYIILLGEPALAAGKTYVEARKPKGLINKESWKSSTYLILILSIFILNFIVYRLYLKDLFMNDIIVRKTPKLENFGVDKLISIIGIRFLIHNLGIGIFYAVHSIFNITDSDYFLLMRLK